MSNLLGTVVSDAIVPLGDNATHYDIFGQGGFRVVGTLAERDALVGSPSLDADGLSAGRRKVDMLVAVVAEGKIYQLHVVNFLTLSTVQRLVALLDNTNWVVFESGISSAVLGLNGQSLTLTTSKGSNTVTLLSQVTTTLNAPSSTLAPSVDAVNGRLQSLLNPRALQTYNFYGVAYTGTDGDLAGALTFIHLNRDDYGVINFYQIYNASSDVTVGFGTLLNGNGRFFRMGNYKITMLTGAMVRDLKPEYNPYIHPNAFAGTFYSAYGANTADTPRLLNCELRVSVTVAANAFIRLTNCDIIGDNWNLGTGTIVLENCREYGTRGTVANGFATVIVLGGGITSATLALSGSNLSLNTSVGTSTVVIPDPAAFIQDNLTSASATKAPSVNAVNSLVSTLFTGAAPFVGVRADGTENFTISNLVEGINWVNTGGAGSILYVNRPCTLGGLVVMARGTILDLQGQPINLNGTVIRLSHNALIRNNKLMYNGRLAPDYPIAGVTDFTFTVVGGTFAGRINYLINNGAIAVLDNVAVVDFNQSTLGGLNVGVATSDEVGPRVVLKNGAQFSIGHQPHPNTVVTVVAPLIGLTGSELRTPVFSAGTLSFSSTNANYSLNLNTLSAGNIYLVKPTTTTSHATYASAFAAATSGDLILIKRNLTDETLPLKDGVDVDASGFTLSMTSGAAHLVNDNNLPVSCTVKALKLVIRGTAAGHGVNVDNVGSSINVAADVYVQSTVPDGAGIWNNNGTLLYRGDIYMSNSAQYGAVCLGISTQTLNGNILSNTTFKGIGAYCLGGYQTINGNIQVLNQGAPFACHAFDGGQVPNQTINCSRTVGNDEPSRQHYFGNLKVFGEIDMRGSTNPNGWGINKTQPTGTVELHSCTILTAPGIFAIGSTNGAHLAGTINYAGSTPVFNQAPDTLFTFVDLSPYRLLGTTSILLVRANGLTSTFSTYPDAEAAAAAGDTLYLTGYFSAINVYKSLTLRGTGTVETLVLGYMGTGLTINVHDLNLSGRCVVCVPDDQTTHTVRIQSIRTGRLTYFEQFGLFTNGGRANVTVKNVLLRSERAYRPLDGAANIGGGVLGYQERDPNGAGMWVFDDCVLESVYGAVFTGYKGSVSRIELRGTTRVVPAAGKPVQETFYVNTSTALPEAQVLVDMRLGIEYQIIVDGTPPAKDVVLTSRKFFTTPLLINASAFTVQLLKITDGSAWAPSRSTSAEVNIDIAAAFADASAPPAIILRLTPTPVVTTQLAYAIFKLI